MQGLVEKVQQLEQKLATAVEASQTASTEQEWSSDNHVPAVESQLQVLPATLSWDVDDLVFPTGDNGMVNLPPGQFTNMLDEPETTSFDGELELLSLEATAERYLGPISGLPFAKLTQMVLRHLWPDKAELIFLRRQEPARQQQSGDDAIIPSDILNSFLHNFNDSAVAYPADPTGFSLSGTTNLKDGLGELRLPAEAQLNHLVDFYFAHSHTLYPILNRTEFTTALRDMQQNPQGPVARSPLWLFKIWTVLAIGSTSYCSVTLAEESESMLYYNKAMQYFESALGYGNMVGHTS